MFSRGLVKILSLSPIRLQTREDQIGIFFRKLSKPKPVVIIKKNFKFFYREF